jgi:phosphoribosyl 1,2-cyclic phosphate phosphodiesterase
MCMKLTFLGTGAGEGYPGYWCECPHCTYARKHRGKNLRTNSSMVIDEELLIDIGPSCFDNAARFGVNLSKIKTLLVTHPHEDHLQPQHLYWRNTDESLLPLTYVEKMRHGGPRFTDIPQLNIYGNSFVMETLRKSLDDMEELKINLHEIKEGKEEKTDGYRILPVRGNHGSQQGFSHSYIIQKDEKTVLYALDSGSYDEDQFALIQEYQYDAVIMEGTTGLNEQYGGHMCLVNNIRIRDRLKENKCLRENSRFLLTHLSPHWCPPHDWYESIVASEGLELAYDGLQIEV